MKQQLNPAVAWVVIAVIVIVVVGVGYKLLSPKSVDYDKKGSEQMMTKVQNGEKMYTPPGGKVDFNGKFIPPGMSKQ